MNGFYDSNPLTYPTGGWPVGGGQTLPLIHSWGYNLSPWVSGAYSTDQTQIGARYMFSMDYYANFPDNKANYSHIFTLFANHRFNERFSLNFDDNFAYSQEPEVLGTAQGSIAVPYRTQQNNLANNANITFNSALTETLTLVLGYSNRYIDYEQTPQDVATAANPYGGGSLDALLTRMENYVLANLEYKLNPKAMVLGGFQYGQINYLGDGYLYSFNPIFTDPSSVPTSADRNNHDHCTYDDCPSDELDHASR